ncbi:MAG TPA: hypothetical protein VN840_12045 [Streptosporangiaceae bacterium]|nr:hypothetical protein [Streptosporangiaceae bacterium]
MMSRVCPASRVISVSLDLLITLPAGDRPRGQGELAFSAPHQGLFG